MAELKDFIYVHPRPSTARLYAGPSASCVVCADIEHTGFCPVNGQSCRNNCWGIDD